jgi:tetratricopeptide (TPR) repeat protein
MDREKHMSNDKLKLALLRILGNFAMYNKNPKRAARYLEAALSIAPNNLKIIDDLQVVYKQIPNWERFFEIYQDAASKWPTKAYIKANIGISYMHLSRYKEATPYLEDFVQSQTKFGSHFSPNIYSRLGICYAYLKSWDLADKVLAKAEEDNPWDVDMIFGRMCVLYGTNRAKDVLDFLEVKIEKYPKMYPLLYWKADYMRYFLRQPEKSLELYRSALDVVNISSYKRKYEPYYFVVNSYCAISTVVRDYLEVISETGRLGKDLSYRTWWWLGIGFENKVTSIYKTILDGNYKLAIRYCEKLLRKRLLPRRRCIVLSHLAMAQSGLGELDQALASSSEAVSLDPYSFFALDKLGSIYLELKQWEDAKKIYQKLSSLEPFDSTIFENLATIFRNTGDIENAIKAYKKALQLDPSNPSTERSFFREN